MDYYLIDSSIVIDSTFTYPFEFFPTLWEKLRNLNKEGKLLIIKSVKSECDNHLKIFFGEKLKITNDETEEIIKNQREIIKHIEEENYSGNIARFVGGADLKLIAYCLLLKNLGKKIMLIHDENEKKAEGNKEMIRIPIICKKFNISQNKFRRGIATIIKEEGFKI